MPDFVQVTTTTETREDAERIARALVERRLAACAQIVGPIHSVYWWEGAVQRSEEWMCILKTSEERFHDLEEAIGEVHPYDVPEVLAVPVVAGNRSYLDWLDEELSHRKEA